MSLGLIGFCQAAPPSTYMIWDGSFRFAKPRKNRWPSSSGVLSRHAVGSSKMMFRSSSSNNSTRPKARRSGKTMRPSSGSKILSVAVPSQRSPAISRTVPSMLVLSRMLPKALPRFRLSRSASVSKFESPTPKENVRDVRPLSAVVSKSPSKPESSTRTSITAIPASASSGGNKRSASVSPLA